MIAQPAVRDALRAGHMVRPDVPGDEAAAGAPRMC
jgi:hypothetical protein